MGEVALVGGICEEVPILLGDLIHGRDEVAWARGDREASHMGRQCRVQFSALQRLGILGRNLDHLTDGVHAFIGAGGGPCREFSLKDLLQSEVEVTLNRGRARLFLEALAVTTVILNDGLVVLHDTIIVRNFD